MIAQSCSSLTDASLIIQSSVERKNHQSLRHQDFESLEHSLVLFDNKQLLNSQDCT